MADKVYIQNGGIFFEPGSATEAVFVSNGQIHYQPAGAGVSPDDDQIGYINFQQGVTGALNISVDTDAITAPDQQLFLYHPHDVTFGAPVAGVSIPILAYHYNHSLRK